MNKSVSVNNSNIVQQFIDAVYRGIESLQEAGDIAARAIAENPNFIDEVCDKCPDLTPEFVKRFESIGLKKLHPSLAINESCGVRRLRKLPYTLQEKYSKEPLPLLVKTESGYDTLLVDVRNLTPDQSVQVFDTNNVRSEAAQRALIEDKAVKRIAPPASLPYKIKGRKLVILQPCEIDRADLANWFAA